MAHRTVFMGTPEFAVPSLEALHAHPAFTLVGVVTQPDRPAGRGQQVTHSAVKQAAEALRLPILQPEKLKDPGAFEQLQAWSPDLIVVAAFGQILRQNVLDLPRYGCINVHASLLPRWRGAAPIQYAIRAGDAETGVTIMLMEAGLDTGPMLRAASIPISTVETAASLHDRLADLGAQLLPQAALDYIEGGLTPTPQPTEGVTLAPSIRKEEGRIDWEQPAAGIDRLVRAFDPWPGTYTFLAGERIKVLGGEPLPMPPDTPHLPPGTLTEHSAGLAAACGGGFYVLRIVQPEGKKPMTGAAFLAGRPDITGKRFSQA